jgi:hypothetical protein
VTLSRTPGCRIVFGAVYSVIMILVIRGGWHYYVFRINRNYPDSTYRVVCMDLAEAEYVSELII